jgi:hypothetical protein
VVAPVLLLVQVPVVVSPDLRVWAQQAAHPDLVDLDLDREHQDHKVLAWELVDLGLVDLDQVQIRD